MTEPSTAALAASIVAGQAASGGTVAVAESLTGGLVLAALTAVPGSSTVVRGGVVAYASDVKADVLGVDPTLLARTGAVDAEVALAMAEGVRDRLGATVGVGTTGEAGPDSASGQPVGTVHVAAVGPAGVVVRSLHLAGDRAAIRAASVHAALAAAAALALPEPPSRG
ncbi:MAG: nicotinamide-nucleotide amidohydrolase family protein [Candidatus Nanopelagicales bacterium]|jgi:nicotinamide-nucleotide amidase|nr:nicotinamide-nucleotide amidohydrolase family protein [Candidatus Nanopelagicales bacterium]